MLVCLSIDCQVGWLCISLSSWSSSCWSAWVLTARSVDCVSLCLPDLLHAGLPEYWLPGRLTVYLSVFLIFFMLVCLSIDCQVGWLCISLSSWSSSCWSAWVLTARSVDCVSLCLPDLLHAGLPEYWLPGRLTVYLSVFLIFFMLVCLSIDCQVGWLCVSLPSRLVRGPGINPPPTRGIFGDNDFWIAHYVSFQYLLVCKMNYSAFRDYLRWYIAA